MKPKTVDGLWEEKQDPIEGGADNSPCLKCRRENTMYCVRFRTCQPYLEWFDKSMKAIRERMNADLVEGSGGKG